jgi:hypothetical protein
MWDECNGRSAEATAGGKRGYAVETDVTQWGARLFDRVHTKIGDAKQARGVVGVLGVNSNTDRGGDFEGVAVEKERFFDGLADRVSKLLDGMRAARIAGCKQGEFVAAKTGEGIEAIDTLA